MALETRNLEQKHYNNFVKSGCWWKKTIISMISKATCKDRRDVAGWIMASTNVHILIPRILRYMVKETLQLWWNQGFWDTEVILDYLSGPRVINDKDPYRREGAKSEQMWWQKQRTEREKEIFKSCAAGSDWWKKGPQTKECRRPLGAGESKAMKSPLESPERTQPCQHLDS